MRKKKNGGNRMDRYPPELRGPAQNKYRGYQMQRERGLRGNTYGKASECRIAGPEERERYALEHGIK